MATDFRKQIKARLAKLGLTKYWLAKKMNAQNAIYAYLREKSPAEVRSDRLEKIFDLLDAEERRQK
jgi:hypothetical protein